MTKVKTITYKVGRIAGNGNFTTVKYAQQHPKTAIVETIKRKVTNNS